MIQNIIAQPMYRPQTKLVPLSGPWAFMDQRPSFPPWNCCITN